MIPIFARAIVAVSLMTGLTACGNASSSAGPTSKASAPPSATGPALRVRESARASLELPSGWIPALLEGGARGVAVLENAAHNDRNRLLFVDVPSLKTQSVRTPQNGWRITNFTTSGNWVAWSEQEGDPLDPMAPVRWRVKSYNIDSRTTSTLLQSPAINPLTPGVQLSRQTLFLSTYNGIRKGTFEISRIRLPSKTRITLFRDIRGGQMAYDGRHLFSTLTERRGSQAGESASDVFELRHSGNRRLSHSGHGVAPDYESGHLMWISKNAVEVASTPRYTRVRTVARHPDPFPSLGAGLFSDMFPRNGHYEARVSSLAHPKEGIWLRPQPKKYLSGIPAMFGHRVYWAVAPSGARGRAVLLNVSKISVD